jgi:hypothetical protein
LAKNDFEGIQTRTIDALNSAPDGISPNVGTRAGTYQPARTERIFALLSQDYPWLIGEGRDQTRRALIELLGEMTDAEFAYVENSRVLLQALPKGRLANVTPYAIKFRPEDVVLQFDVRFEFITLDADLEPFPFEHLKCLVRGALAFAFAKLDGFDDWQATQIAEAAKLNPSGRVD